MQGIRILFAGTPDFAVPALSALIEAGHEVVGVYTQPDRPAGRGRKTAPSPVKQTALNAGLPVFQPLSLKDPASAEQIRSLGADLMVVAAYGLILPPAVLAAPRLGCVNIHASLLPRWRGAAPIQRAILAGDEVTGISLMRMEQGLDTGPVFVKRETRIEPRDTGGSLHDRLAHLGAALLLESLPDIVSQRVIAESQAEDGATYATKLAKTEAPIDWQQSSAAIDRQIRAFNPWPVAQTICDEQTLRIWEAAPMDSTEHGDAGGLRPGTVIGSGAHGLDVATGDGVLRVMRLQLPGKRPVAAADFANAYTVDGAVLG
jgi:methionyl-tRNA formyltransferase